jgi:hypothetical protein
MLKARSSTFSIELVDVDVDRPDDVQVRRQPNLGRRQIAFRRVGVDEPERLARQPRELVIIFEPPRLQYAEQVGEVVLDMRQVHLVQHDEPGQPVPRIEALLRPQQETQERRPLVLRRQRVVVAEQTLAVTPVGADGEEEAAVLLNRCLITGR